MSEYVWWMVLVLAIVLLAANAVRPDVWAALWHERFDPLLHRIRHH